MRKIDADAIDLTHYEGADIHTLEALLADEPTVDDVVASWMIQDDQYICPVCLEGADDMYDFCPNCGTKME